MQASRKLTGNNLNTSDQREDRIMLVCENTDSLMERTPHVDRSTSQRRHTFMARGPKPPTSHSNCYYSTCNKLILNSKYHLNSPISRGKLISKRLLQEFDLLP